VSAVAPADGAKGGTGPEVTAGEARSLTQDVDPMLVEVVAVTVRLDELLASERRPACAGGCPTGSRLSIGRHPSAGVNPAVADK
jgi:hypothetical protein